LKVCVIRSCTWSSILRYIYKTHPIADNNPATMSLKRPHPNILTHFSLSRTSTRHYAAPGSGTIPLSKKKYIPTTGTYPLGFKAGTAHVGVKASNTRFDDVALIASDTPCASAAVFTTNKFQAAPVTVSREILRKRGGNGIRAVVVNSGCANAVTGKGGIEDAVAMGEGTDACFAKEGKGEEDGMGSRTIVMSTGVIGQRYAYFQFHPSQSQHHINITTSVSPSTK
jgi:glutamate N-acetyltransferase/amino-acid N-acetyltransferase